MFRYRVVISASILAGWFVSFPAHSEYSHHFDRGWNYTQVSDGQVNLATGDDDCQVKAHGWVLLGTERRKKPDASWYERGDLYQHWAYRVIVHNTTENTQEAGFSTTLMSDRGFELDIPMPRYGIKYELIYPGRAAIVQETRVYRVRDELGEPSSIEWRFTCSQRVNLHRHFG